MTSIPFLYFNRLSFFSDIYLIADPIPKDFKSLLDGLGQFVGVWLNLQVIHDRHDTLVEKTTNQIDWNKV